jgi:hypothetical protein
MAFYQHTANFSINECSFVDNALMLPRILRWDSETGSRVANTNIHILYSQLKLGLKMEYEFGHYPSQDNGPFILFLSRTSITLDK